MFSAILFGENEESKGRHIGCLDPACDISAVVQDAYDNARFVCDQYYLASPEIVIHQCNNLDNTLPIRTVYVPSHLYHMLFELFKNSMRAVMEQHHDSVESLPEIKVLIVRGKEDICVKVSKIKLRFLNILFLVCFKFRFRTKAVVFPDHKLISFSNICIVLLLIPQNRI